MKARTSLATASPSITPDESASSAVLVSSDDYLVDRADLKQKYAIKHSRNWLYHLIRDGRFPMPLILGGRHVWWNSQIRAWLETNLRPADLTLRSNEEIVAREQRRQKSREAAFGRKPQRQRLRDARRRRSDGSRHG